MLSWRPRLIMGSLAVVSCSGGTAGLGPHTTNSLTATINGEQVAATDLQVTFGATDVRITGQWTDGAVTKQLVFDIYGDLTPGTTDIAAQFLTYASYFETRDSTTAEWTTALNGATGSITFTVKSATRVAGTFSFVAVPVPHTGSTGSRTVTHGAFDLVPETN